MGFFIDVLNKKESIESNIEQWTQKDAHIQLKPLWNRKGYSYNAISKIKVKDEWSGSKGIKTRLELMLYARYLFISYM